jgi:predicted acylesterase/phospholipase RssA
MASRRRFLHQPIKESMRVVSVQEFRSREFGTVVFAGGGNRCWWQAGMVEGLRGSTVWRPTLFLGASAGAGIAVAAVTDRLRVALAAAVDRFSITPANVDWSKLLKGQRPFVLPQIYPDWIKSFLGGADFQRLRQSSIEVQVALTRLIRFLPVSVSTAFALALYSTEKFWLRTLHGRWPHYAGLRSEHVVINQCATVGEASSLLLASAAAVPITPTHLVGGRVALDGGFYDSIPLPKEPNRTGGDTLVLVTRHRPQRPQIFESQGRIYLQPRAAVPVTNMDCTNPVGVVRTFEQGLSEAEGLRGAAR